jgi:hypothetical protein
MRDSFEADWPAAALARSRRRSVPRSKAVMSAANPIVRLCDNSPH